VIGVEKLVAVFQDLFIFEKFDLEPEIAETVPHFARYFQKLVFRRLEFRFRKTVRFLAEKNREIGKKRTAARARRWANDHKQKNLSFEERILQKTGNLGFHEFWG